jgi:hypothetical protein
LLELIVGELAVGTVAGTSKVVDGSVGSGAGVVVGTGIGIGLVGTGIGIGLVGAGIAVVVPSSPPARVGMAYGGSKRPNRPQALHGQAHDLIALGARRMGSHRGSGLFVAMTEAGRVWGQSVPRSLRDSCRVAVSSGRTRVETSSRSKAQIVLEASGPTLPRLLVPYMVLMNMYTDGDVKV